MKKQHLPLLAGLFALTPTGCEPGEPEDSGAADGPAISASTLQSEMLADLGEIRDKSLGLAEAMPQSAYGWRPAEGVGNVIDPGRVRRVPLRCSLWDAVRRPRQGLGNAAGCGSGSRRAAPPPPGIPPTAGPVSPREPCWCIGSVRYGAPPGAERSNRQRVMGLSLSMIVSSFPGRGRAAE